MITFKSSLFLSITFFSVLFDAELQEASDTFLLECNSDDPNPCAASIVTDCQQHDKHCIIDCTKSENICKDAEFICHSNQDCTLICDSKNAIKPCLGTILKATQSSNINVNVICSNIRACEWMIIYANSSNINLNITITSDDPDPGLQHALYIAKHSNIYLPQSGHSNIECHGHSACHSMKIFGNTTTTKSSMDSQIQFKSSGIHSFKDSYLSFPSHSDIEIICGDQNGNDNGACLSASFDGTQSGDNSNINIKCHGNNGCHNTSIVSNTLSESLIIDGRDGDNILSNADIHCYIDCNIGVYGNGSNMLLNTNIHSYHGHVDLKCDYSTSVQFNCYQNQQSGPTIYCNDNGESCRLILSETEWKCFDEQITICDGNIDIDINHFFLSTEEDENDFNDTDGDILVTIPMDDDNILDNVEEAIKTGLLYNTKGQIALGTIIGVLLCLCVAVCIAKRDTMRECLYGEAATSNGGGHSINEILYRSQGNDIMHIPIGMHGKNKYASLNEVEDSELMDNNDINDIIQVSEEEEFEEDTD